MCKYCQRHVELITCMGDKASINRCIENSLTDVFISLSGDLIFASCDLINKEELIHVVVPIQYCPMCGSKLHKAMT